MNIVVMGRRGQGKSTLARFLAERIQQRVDAHTIVVFDPKRTFRSVPHTSDLAMLEEMLTDPEYSIIAYQPLGSEDGDSDVNSEFDSFVRVLGIDFHLGMGEKASRKNLSPFVLVVDEAWLLQQRGSINGSLARLVRLADSDNFYLIQAAHRPFDFNTSTRAQVDELFLFRQFLKDDLDIIETWAGSAVAAQVSTLPKYHVVRFEIATETSELWATPEAWYIDNTGEQQNGHPIGKSIDSDGESAEGDCGPETGGARQHVEVASDK